MERETFEPKPGSSLRRTDERHALVIKASEEGWWDGIVETDEFHVSPRLRQMYGFDADTEFAGRAAFLARFPFHPDDRATWQQAIEAHFAGRTKRFDIEMRMLPHGQLRWMHLTGLLVRDAAGNPVRWTGAVRDITARKEADQLRHEEAMNWLADTLAGGSSAREGAGGAQQQTSGDLPDQRRREVALVETLQLLRQA